MKLRQRKKDLIMLPIFFLLICFFASSGCYAAPDPSINDWGSPPGSPPPWQTSDIFVDNDGDGIHDEAEDISTGQLPEPSKGLKNRLFAKIRNLGSSMATNITLRFAYAPYGAWSPASISDFKEIAVLTGVSLGPAGSSDSEKLIEVEWDLTNLSENNGGQWGGFTVGDFDHFCVWVRIESSEDSDTTNNKAQNNFTNVKTVLGKVHKMKFLISNPKKREAKASLIINGFPKNWKYNIDGVKNHNKFVLKAKEVRLIALTFIPPAQLRGKESFKNNVDISLKLNKKIIGGMSFTATVVEEKSRPFAPSGGVLSPYLTGTFDLRKDGKTVLHIINPTAKHLRVMVAFFDDNEKPLKCIHDKLSPNDLLEIDVRKYDLEAKIGVVKVVSLHKEKDVPETGIVGYQRHFLKKMGVTESILHPVPLEILVDDLKYIWKICK